MKHFSFLISFVFLSLILIFTNQALAAPQQDRVEILGQDRDQDIVVAEPQVEITVYEEGNPDFALDYENTGIYERVVVRVETSENTRLKKYEILMGREQRNDIITNTQQNQSTVALLTLDTTKVRNQSQLVLRVYVADAAGELTDFSFLFTTDNQPRIHHYSINDQVEHLITKRGTAVWAQWQVERANDISIVHVESEQTILENLALEDTVKTAFRQPGTYRLQVNHVTEVETLSVHRDIFVQLDTDEDGLIDSKDNCPLHPNPNQEDFDRDRRGDVCDPDDDGDNIKDIRDNCLMLANPQQIDTDADGMGNACDPDDDNDNHLDNDDNCPLHPNENQNDLDNDDQGDVCDDNIDGDNFANDQDNCPLIPNNDQLNNDNDGQGDVCDVDDDNDSIEDVDDNCPFHVNADQIDTDADNLGNVCDPDDDNDNRLDNNDNCPLHANADQNDTDADGQGDVCDNNIDGDDFENAQDNCPTIINNDQLNNDNDAQGDACDVDDDNDGVEDVDDNCPFDTNEAQADRDNDGQGDTCDDDVDGDGIANGDDNCRVIANADQNDTDADGQGDACDSNIDGDDFENAQDNCPTIVNNDQLNNDNDAQGDVCDADDDNDNVEDVDDNCPVDANEDQADRDNDGVGNVCDDSHVPEITAISTQDLGQDPLDRDVIIHWQQRDFDLDNLSSTVNLFHGLGCEGDRFEWHTQGFAGTAEPMERTASLAIFEPKTEYSYTITVTDGEDATTSECQRLVTGYPGMVAWWRFNESLEDYSGRDHHGDFVGGDELYTADNVPQGSSIELDGDNDTIVIPDHDDLQPSSHDFSVEFWVKLNGLPNTDDNDARYSLMYKGAALNTNCGEGNQHWTITQRGEGENHALKIQQTICEGEVANRNVSTMGDSINDTAWHHVAIVYQHAHSNENLEFDTVTYYLDGILAQATYTSPRTALERANYNGDLYLGSIFNLHSYFNGQLDEVAIYNKALTIEEIHDSCFAYDMGNCKEDRDGDTIEDDVDNCPDVANVDQEDLDQDGIGNICDQDVDGDGVNNDVDNCRVVANGNQEDWDGNGVGDACDEEPVLDGILIVNNAPEANCSDRTRNSAVIPYCTIGAALEDAEDGNAIEVRPGIYVQERALFINKEVTISGENPEHTIIDAGGTLAGLSIREHNMRGTNVEISNLTLRNGQYGLYLGQRESEVTVNNCIIRDNNTGIWSGGYGDQRSQLTVNSSIISNNRGGNKGGISVFNALDLFVNSSSIIGNSAEIASGGISVISGASLFLRNSDVSFNITNNVENDTLQGGGIAFFGNDLFIERSSITHNSSYKGGGIYVLNQNQLARAMIKNSTIAYNEASQGGGIYMLRRGRLTLQNTTIAHNQADTGGGIYRLNFWPQDNWNDIGRVDLKNTILWGNIARVHGPTSSVRGVIYSNGGGNLVENVDFVPNCAEQGQEECFDEEGNAIGPGGSDEEGGFINRRGDDLIDVNPLLGEFDFHGTPTRFFSLLPNSPAIDAGSSSSCTNEDQRGFVRNRQRCDIGSFELEGRNEGEDENGGDEDNPDNCPEVPDNDNDGQGDACDNDDDNDGVHDINDNCPLQSNEDQSDIDNDGQGDVCDSNIDGDDFENAQDNCPLNHNNDQANLDDDDLGDECDNDKDGDGSPVELDCDDRKAIFHPGRQESFDGIDNDCDGEIDEEIWQQVSVGTFHACGLRRDGRVQCWGSRGGAKNMPEDRFIKINSGFNYNCGIKEDATIKCWGSSLIFRGDDLPPPEGRFIDVSVGEGFVCGIRENGELACWGDNNIARSNTVLSNVPEGNFVELSASEWYICALAEDGEIECWGRDYRGETQPPEGRFIQVSAEGGQACGLQQNNHVICWGSDRFVESARPFNMIPFDHVSVGYSRACGLTQDGSIHCWGGPINTPLEDDFIQIDLSGRVGACGVRQNGSLKCWGENHTLAYAIKPPLGIFKQIAAGNEENCGLRQDGRLDCWGSNFHGSVNSPNEVFTQISAGDYHACGVREDMGISCWGENRFDIPEPPVGNWLQVSAGHIHNCAIRSDHEVICWGNNEYGQASSPGPELLFRQVSTGPYHTCGLLLENNSVHCWGSNNNGELNVPDGEFTQISVGMVYSSHENDYKGYTCGLRDDGTVACWGREFENIPEGRYTQITTLYGTLGMPACGIKENGTVECWTFSGELIAIDLPDKNFVQVSRGQCALSEDGLVACWGARHFNPYFPD